MEAEATHGHPHTAFLQTPTWSKLQHRARPDRHDLIPNSNQPYRACHCQGTGTGTIEQLIVTPIRSWELIPAKIIPYILVSFADTILILVVGTILFGVPMRGSLMLLFRTDRPLPAAHTWVWSCDLDRRPNPAASPINGHACHAAGNDAFRLHFSNRIPAHRPSICRVCFTSVVVTYIMRAVVVKGVGLDLIILKTTRWVFLELPCWGLPSGVSERH